MKLKITAVFYLIAAFAIFAHLQNVNVFAQQTKHGKKGNVKKPKVIELKSARGTVGQNEKDPNIKIDDAPNSPNEKARQPAAKGGAKVRGGGDCKVVFDNYTGFRIKLYVNEAYRGTVASFNNAYLYIAPNPETIVYARADFTDGSFLVWGPESYECGANQFVYFKLTSDKN